MKHFFTQEFEECIRKGEQFLQKAELAQTVGNLEGAQEDISSAYSMFECAETSSKDDIEHLISAKSKKYYCQELLEEIDSRRKEEMEIEK